VNGDGKADIVAFGQDGVWVSLATGDGSFAAPKLVLDDFGASAAAGGWSSQSQYPRELADVNGDGMADIVAFGQDGVWVSLATGGGNFAAPKLVLDNFGASSAAGGWSSDSQFPRVLGDVNGDGRADIVGFAYNGVWVAHGNTSGGFDTPTFDFKDLGFADSAGGWSSADTLSPPSRRRQRRSCRGPCRVRVQRRLCRDLERPTSPVNPGPWEVDAAV
jgi:hypothetical protein